ncbi:hypothetical protein BJH93_08190 [Kocuria polaris]|nr:hypothetical protein [Kocuria polaris]
MNRFELRRDAESPYEFVVDGVPLLESVYGPAYRDSGEITLLGVPRALIHGEQQVRRLTGELPGENSPNRVGLYVCPVCLDEFCGGVSVSLQFEPDRVIWRDISYDVGGPDWEDCDSLADDAEEGLGPFVFDRHLYTAALENALRQLQDEHRAEQTRLARLAEELGNRTGFWAWRRRRGRHRSIGR